MFVICYRFENKWKGITYVEKYVDFNGSYRCRFWDWFSE